MNTRIKKWFLVCLALMLVNLLFHFLVILPRQKQMLLLQEELMSHRFHPVLNDVGNGDAKWATIEADMKKLLQSRIPPIFSLPEYAQRIAGRVEANGLSLEGKMAFQPGKGGPLSLKSYYTVINIAGKYRALKQFIADLQNFPEVLSIDAMTFTRSLESKGPVKLTLKMTFFFKEGPDE